MAKDWTIEQVAADRNNPLVQDAWKFVTRGVFAQSLNSLPRQEAELFWQIVRFFDRKQG